MMRMTDAFLADLKARQAMGQDITEGLIAWAKLSYVRDEMTLEQMEGFVEGALRERIIWLQPGERVLSHARA